MSDANLLERYCQTAFVSRGFFYSLIAFIVILTLSTKMSLLTVVSLASTTFVAKISDVTKTMQRGTFTNSIFPIMMKQLDEIAVMQISAVFGTL